MRNSLETERPNKIGREVKKSPEALRKRHSRWLAALKKLFGREGTPD